VELSSSPARHFDCGAITARINKRSSRSVSRGLYFNAVTDVERSENKKTETLQALLVFSLEGTKDAWHPLPVTGAVFSSFFNKLLISVPVNNFYFVYIRKFYNDLPGIVSFISNFTFIAWKYTGPNIVQSDRK
jgi:hypothetical protein